MAVRYLCCETLRKKSPNTGEQPEARAQIEGPQIKNIYIKGLKVFKMFSLLWLRPAVYHLMLHKHDSLLVQQNRTEIYEIKSLFKFKH
jgi:hypothetical protein